MRKILILLTLTLSHFALANETLSPHQSDYEQSILQTIENIQALNHEQALVETQALVKKYPTSKVGQLLMADLLMAKAGILSNIGANNASESAVGDLKFEIEQRLSHISTPARSGLLPENIIQLPDSQAFIIVLDQSESRLYIYRNAQGTPILEKDYFLTIGLKGSGKEKRGDQKTPIGVYHVTRHIADEKLPDLYGRGAFPVSYPNVWDIRRGRTGGGIWLHGTPSYTYNRAPWASNGCMVVSNNDFLDLSKYIDPSLHTTVINADKINWITTEQWRENQKQMLQILTRWLKDWEKNDHEPYIDHYSKSDFNAYDRNYNKLNKYKRWVNRNKTDISIEYNNLGIFKYPGEDNLILMQYDQSYRSNLLNVDGPKEVFWKQQSNGWKIVYEGSRDFRKLEETVVEN